MEKKKKGAESKSAGDNSVLKAGLLFVLFVSILFHMVVSGLVGEGRLAGLWDGLKSISASSEMRFNERRVFSPSWKLENV